ncbi:AHH domain-containing protein [Hyalangium rubrum]|uniref:AHH domain-containing protein n=1 Tax=Hyalangium rubrum TaxID=3103134 RepID=A0ABU5H1I9_9BACT|nr:AHH domain-containing protein [Hyalangium sp. s54d21]MDY7227186.1 AHH domain-containing protein [Hyalangium sp. s54d21]
MSGVSGVKSPDISEQPNTRGSSEGAATGGCRLSNEASHLPVCPCSTTSAESGPVDDLHLATICNDKSILRGGPWSPRFREIFAKAGMKLNDPANKLPLEGHQGPHPYEYHRLVYQTLRRATQTCRSVAECRVRLTGALQDLAQQIATPGTELNRLVTRANPR